MNEKANTEQSRVEFWFDFGSNYSYLSVMRIEELARQAGVSVAWKPFLLGPIFRELGWTEAPFVQQKEKGRYVWQDMARQARKYGLAFNKPSVFPRTAVLPLRVVLHAADQPWVAEFCRRIMRSNWVEDVDVDNRECVGRALQGLASDPEAVIAAATTEENKLRLREQTARAGELGIFGAPTFFARGEMFWGDDRLEDALAFARQ